MSKKVRVVTGNVVFVCPETMENSEVMSENLWLEGQCANENYPSDHRLFFHCSKCDTDHQLGF